MRNFIVSIQFALRKIRQKNGYLYIIDLQLHNLHCIDWRDGLQTEVQENMHRNYRNLFGGIIEKCNRRD